MAVASVTYTFVPLTLIESAEANTNFQDLVTFLNNQVIHKDASVAFTGTPSGPAADPVSDNQFARKAYVDGSICVLRRAWSLASSSASQLIDSFTVEVARGVTGASTGITVLTTGNYRVGFSMQAPSSGLNSVGAKLQVNSVDAQGLSMMSGFGVGSITPAVHMERQYMPLTAGDVIRLYAYQNTGSPQAVNAEFWIEGVR